MPAPLTIYGDPTSGNCLKVKWVAAHLNIPTRWVDVDVVAGGAKAPDVLALNPAGRVPFVVLPDGQVLARTRFIADDELTLADVALVAYTRMAGEGGFDLAPYPAVRAWIGRVEAALAIESLP